MALRRVACAAVLLVGSACALPHFVWAQASSRLGLRAGAGVDRSGGTVYTGQVEFTDRGDAHSSVEVAITGWGSTLIQDFHDLGWRGLLHDYHEETDAAGGGVIGNFLFRHALRGPYFVIGLGAGYFQVDWRLDSPTDPGVGTRLPGGGSFQEEGGMTIGPILNVGVGQRLFQRFDVRAQVPTTLLATKSSREELKVMPVFTLTAGVGF